MKKILISSLVPIAIFAFVVLVSSPVNVEAVTCPAGYICTVLPACPEGYICTPVAQISNCPTGYICKATTDTTVTTATNSNKCYQYTTNLRQGSMGIDVETLQSWLMKLGYDIPAISSGQATKGYYGSQTVTALQRYQNANGITESYFGPLTRAKFNTVCTASSLTGTNANTNTSTNIKTDTSQAPGTTVSAYLYYAGEDKAGAWGQFSPNAANVNSNPNDWQWYATVTLPSQKTISRITVKHNLAGEVWSTGDSRYLNDGADLYGYKETPYPLVVTRDGSQVNTVYNQNIMTGTGTYNLKLYGQPESSRFSGGKIYVEFTDGTQAVGIIPASSITPTQVTTQTTASDVTSIRPTISNVQSAGDPENTIHANNWATIYGTGLSGMLSVKVGGSTNPVTVTETYGTTARFIVPSLPSGFPAVYVTNSSGQTSAGHIVTLINPKISDLPQSSITSIYPTSGPVGSMVSITGSGFGSYNRILIAGNTYLASSSNGSTISFAIPGSVSIGSYGLSVVNDSDLTIGKNSNTHIFTVTSSTPTGSLSITPSVSMVNSGSTVTLNFTTHSNAVSSALYLSCPSGVSAVWIGDIGGNTSLCNKMTKFNSATVRSVVFRIDNTTFSAQNIVPNFYEYLSDNPNYAVGVSSQVTVQPATTVSTIPTANIWDAFKEYLQKPQ